MPKLLARRQFRRRCSLDWTVPALSSLCSSGAGMNPEYLDSITVPHLPHELRSCNGNRLDLASVRCYTEVLASFKKDSSSSHWEGERTREPTFDRLTTAREYARPPNSPSKAAVSRNLASCKKVAAPSEVSTNRRGQLRGNRNKNT